MVDSFARLAKVAIPCRCDLPLVGYKLHHGNIAPHCRRCGMTFEPVAVPIKELIARQLPEVWRMEGQPRWREGEEPTRIENVCWGFSDHFGATFHIPKGIRGRVDAANNNGEWVWVTYPGKSG